jgi:hypothetical protein
MGRHGLVLYDFPVSFLFCVVFGLESADISAAAAEMWNSVIIDGEMYQDYNIRFCCLVVICLLFEKVTVIATALLINQLGISVWGLHREEIVLGKSYYQIE